MPLLKILSSYPALLDDLLNINYFSSILSTHVSILRMLICFLTSYLFSLFERQFFVLSKAGKEQSENCQNRTRQQLFHAIVGFFYLFYCFKEECFYNYFTIFVQYLIIILDKRLFQSSGSRAPMQSLTWLFQVGFLTYGYSFMYGSSTEYVVNWTMSQCVLTLKMIQVATDCSDGLKPLEKIKPDRLETVISAEKFPNLLEFISYSTYYNTVFVGPQMTLAHYRNYLDAVHVKKAGFLNFRSETRKIGLTKLIVSLSMMAFFALACSSALDDSVWLTEDGAFFTSFSYFEKIKFITIYGNLKMFRYVSTWSLVEGSLILAGIGTCYEKLKRSDKSKTVHHYHCSNANAFGLLTATQMNDYIETFNINTNKWCFTYLFKRLAFLGSKDLSQIVTLLFLALWHGYFAGYFSCFLFEFLVLTCEKQMVKAGLFIKGYSPPAGAGSDSESASLLTKAVYFSRGVFQKFFQVFLISGYAQIDFSLLKFNIYLKVWKAVYFYGPIVCLSQYLLGSFVIMRSKKKKRKEE